MSRDVLAGVQITLVVATGTMTTVRYAEYPYNSYATYGGRYLASGDEGLFALDTGDTDAGTAIEAYIETGDMDFGTEMQKRVSDIYVGASSAGPLQATLSADELPVGSYLLNTQNQTNLSQTRAAVGKGGRGKYWRLKLGNTVGCDFSLDTVNVAVVSLSRRI